MTDMTTQDQAVDTYGQSQSGVNRTTQTAVDPVTGASTSASSTRGWSGSRSHRTALATSTERTGVDDTLLRSTAIPSHTTRPLPAAAPVRARRDRRIIPLLYEHRAPTSLQLRDIAFSSVRRVEARRLHTLYELRGGAGSSPAVARLAAIR
jgi:hypothetical protein